MASHYSFNGLQQDYLYLFSISACASWIAWRSVGKSNFLFPWKLGRSEISHRSPRMDIWTLSFNFYLFSFPASFILLISHHWVIEQLELELPWSIFQGGIWEVPWMDSPPMLCSCWMRIWSQSSLNTLLKLVIFINCVYRRFISGKGEVSKFDWGTEKWSIFQFGGLVYFHICCWRKPGISSSSAPGQTLRFPELGPSSDKTKIFWDGCVDFLKETQYIWWWWALCVLQVNCALQAVGWELPLWDFHMT